MDIITYALCKKNTSKSLEPITENIEEINTNIANIDTNIANIDTEIGDISSILDTIIGLNDYFAMFIAGTLNEPMDLSGEDITNIRSYAFYNYLENLNIILPSTITNIGQHAFANSNVKVNFEDLNQLINIGAYSFDSNTSLTNLILPDTATTLGEYAFNNCTNLENFEFNETLTSIPNNILSNCVKLSVVNLKNISDIGENAFAGCSNIIEYNFSSQDEVPTIATNSLDISNQPCKIIFKASILGNIMIDSNWEPFISKAIGVETLISGAALPNYAQSPYTTTTWYSDKECITVVTQVDVTGNYYCKITQ